MPVVEISDSYLGTAVYADIGYLSRLIDEEFAVSGVQLAVDRDPAHRAALYHELKQMPALQASIHEPTPSATSKDRVEDAVGY